MTMLAGKADPPSGTVLVYAAREIEPEHERIVHFELGKRIAGLLGLPFGGAHRGRGRHKKPVYLIPTDTLIGTELAQALGVHSEANLFGGVAPHAFISTKAITHPLLDPHAQAPQGWSHDFSQRVKDSVLEGVTVFSIGDAQRAGIRLLRNSTVSIKHVLATAGRGHITISSLEQLTAVLEQMDQRRIAETRLGMEQNKLEERRVGKERGRTGKPRGAQN